MQVAHRDNLTIGCKVMLKTDEEIEILRAARSNYSYIRRVEYFMGKVLTVSFVYKEDDLAMVSHERSKRLREHAVFSFDELLVLDKYGKLERKEVSIPK